MHLHNQLRLEKSISILAFFAITVGIMTISMAQDIDRLFFPTGIVGDANDITINKNDPECNCITITYSPHGEQRFSGLIWQYPAYNWGNKAGRNLTGVSRISFDVGGNCDNCQIRANFIVGYPNDTYYTVYPANLSMPRYSKSVLDRFQMAPLSIDLTGKNLTNVTAGFGCLIMRDENLPQGCKIYLKNIRFSRY